ncbi:hypothetical protein ACKTEK_02930 [Tepidamorphus sp. 3E244]|uniref:hypothetical protein n=1 Tax=Tepidamorphus sp. 3E244 TaxID=3385498 RepID=UPI0038FC07F8
MLTRLIAAGLLLFAGSLAARADEITARQLDAEEQMSGLPNVSAGIVFRVPGNSPLWLEDGPALASDLAVVLIARPGTTLQQFFDAARSAAPGEDDAPQAMVTAIIGDLLYAEVAGCGVAEASGSALLCTAQDGGSFEIDGEIASPGLAFTIRQNFTVTDDPTYTRAGKKVLVPDADGFGWTLVLPHVQ